MFRLLHVYPFFDRVPSRACDDEIIPVGCSHFMAISNTDLVLDAVGVRMQTKQSYPSSTLEETTDRMSSSSSIMHATHQNEADSAEHIDSWL